MKTINTNRQKLTAAILVVAGAVGANAANIPLNGLIGHWDGNGNANDSSSVGNNGSFGGAFVTDTQTGKLAFNLAAKVTIPDHPAYDFRAYNGWTVSYRFNTQGGSLHNATFLGQDDGPGFRPKWFVDYGYTVFGDNDRFNFHVNDFNQERIFVSSASVPEANLQGWKQVTVTIDNTDSGRVDFYLDGDPIGTTYMGNYALQPTAPLVFGFAEGSLGFSGLMDEVLLYDRALPAAEVKDLHTATSSPPSTHAPDSASSWILLTVGIVAVGGFRCGVGSPALGGHKDAGAVGERDHSAMRSEPGG